MDLQRDNLQESFMMRRLVLATLCFLIQGTGLCYGLNQTIYINPNGASQTLEGYAKKNTTVYWKVLVQADGTAPSFTVEFPHGVPCKSSDPKDLTASLGHPAKCKIRLPKGYKNGDVLRFQYQLNPPPKGPDNQIFFQHVGSCDPCDSGGPSGATPAVAKPANTTIAATTYLPLTYLEDIYCTVPYVRPDPLKVFVGDTVFWENPNGAGSPKWTITFDMPACKTAPTFNDPSCVATTASDTAYTYHVVVGNPKSPTCKFDANMTVSTPPAK
jgi:hypothetical protein